MSATGGGPAAGIRRSWDRHGRAAAYLALAGMAAVIAARMRFALPHALRDEQPWSAVNLTYRIEELTRFFGGETVYGFFNRLTYPPATYLMLWPIAGSLPRDGARVLWLVSTLLAAAALAVLAYHLTPGRPTRERLLIPALIFASYPLQISIFLAQFPVLAIALAVAGAFVLLRKPASWGSDVAGAVLLAASLIKPTLTPPLVAAALIAAGRWRPALLAGGVYLVLALAAASAQATGFIALHRAWLSSNTEVSLGIELTEGLPNLHALLASLGLGMWGPAAALLFLAAFAVWAWVHRRADPWLLLGAGALVARLWSYHRPYDDIIIVIAIIALLRAARLPEGRLTAGVLLVVASAALLTPAWAFYDLSAGMIRVVESAHVALWMITLTYFLLRTPRRSHDASSRRGAPARTAAPH